MLKSPRIKEIEEYKPKLPDSLLLQRPMSLEDLKFVFSQVEKRVKETADDGGKINSISLTIIGICITFITGIIGYLITKYDSAPLPVIGCGIYLVVSLVNICSVLKPNIYPIKYRSIGSYPSDLMVDQIFENLEDGETVEKRMIYSEILEYEERVMLNKHNNDFRNELLKTAYNNLFLMPVLSVCCFAVLFLLILIFNLA